MNENYFSIDNVTGDIKYTNIGKQYLRWRFSMVDIDIDDIKSPDMLMMALARSKKISNVKFFKKEKEVIREFERNALMIFVNEGYESAIKYLKDKNMYI